MVPQDLAYLADRGVDPLLDVDENVSAPQFFFDLTTADDLASPLYQQHQQLQREILQPYFRSSALQLVAIFIKCEFPESQYW